VSCGDFTVSGGDVARSRDALRKAATRQAGAAAFASENGAAWPARTHFAARWSTSNAAQLVTGIADDLLASTPYVEPGVRALACVDIAVWSTST